MKKLLIHSLLISTSLIGGSVFAAPEQTPPLKKSWSHQGPFGVVDKAKAQRGFQVYKEVCAACHGLKLVHFRNLAALGYNEAEVKAIAAQYDITDGPDDLGEMFERAGIPADAFPSPYPNENAARAANNASLPPDLSLITKARVGGADYIYSLLTGYQDEPPQDRNLPEGMFYNPYFPGHQIAMMPPLQEGIITYSDGSEPSVNQMADDVVTFLSWAAEPELEARKEAGYKVLMYLLLFTILMYFAMRRVWSRLK